MKIMFVGDTHGDINWWVKLCYIAAENKPDLIVQLGDFGYWEHTKGGIKYLNQLNTLIEELGINLYWIDGNHENHPLLHKTYKEQNEQGFTFIRSNIYFIPRGTSWYWDDIKFLGVGGAYSVDKEYRVAEFARAKQIFGDGLINLSRYESWWPTEQISHNDVVKATSHGEVDVLLSHDIPDGVDLYPYLGPIQNRWKIDEIAAGKSRKQLRVICDVAKPRYIFHGHYHMRVRQDWDHDGKIVKIEGLANEHTGDDGFIFVDTGGLK